LGDEGESGGVVLTWGYGWLGDFTMRNQGRSRHNAERKDKEVREELYEVTTTTHANSVE
jgi:hypothetical protein